jgi:hypothetical protein
MWAFTAVMSFWVPLAWFTLILVVFRVLFMKTWDMVLTNTRAGWVKNYVGAAAVSMCVYIHTYHTLIHTRINGKSRIGHAHLSYTLGCHSFLISLTLSSKFSSRYTIICISALCKKVKTKRLAVQHVPTSRAFEHKMAYKARYLISNFWNLNAQMYVSMHKLAFVRYRVLRN